MHLPYWSKTRPISRTFTKSHVFIGLIHEIYSLYWSETWCSWWSDPKSDPWIQEIRFNNGLCGSTKKLWSLPPFFLKLIFLSSTKKWLWNKKIYSLSLSLALSLSLSLSITLSLYRSLLSSSTFLFPVIFSFLFFFIYLIK